MALGIEASYKYNGSEPHYVPLQMQAGVIRVIFRSHKPKKKGGKKGEGEHEENQTRQLLYGAIRHDSDTLPQ